MPSQDSKNALSTFVGLPNMSTVRRHPWSGSVEVESTIKYRIEVTAADTKPRLRFHDTAPGDYTACAAGEPVDGNMFPGASPAGTWVDDQTSTAGRNHPLTLGLDARWADGPDATLGNTTITFTGIPDAF